MDEEVQVLRQHREMGPNLKLNSVGDSEDRRPRLVVNPVLARPDVDAHDTRLPERTPGAPTRSSTVPASERQSRWTAGVGSGLSLKRWHFL